MPDKHQLFAGLDPRTNYVRGRVIVTNRNGINTEPPFLKQQPSEFHLQVRQTSSENAKSRQQWSEEETQCFLALWSSSEVQNKLEGASWTQPVFEKIQREMAAATYDQSVEQLINKLKKLKKNYKDQKKELECSSSGQLKRNPHFAPLHSLLGNRPSNQVMGALNSATATTAMLESMVDDSVVQTTTTDPGKFYFSSTLLLAYYEYTN